VPSLGKKQVESTDNLFLELLFTEIEFHVPDFSLFFLPHLKLNDNKIED